MRVLVVADRGDSDPGFVGERLEQHGAVLTTTLRDDLPATPPPPAAEVAELVLLLGSHHGVADAGRQGHVDAESALVLDALATDVPVIAICYGAQLAGHALGGRVGKAPEHEIGWYYVDSHDPALCPPGPWLQYHFDTFAVPDGARLLGESGAGPQGFVVESSDRLARLVAWQFHPEVTPGTLQRWFAEDEEALPQLGVDAPGVVTEAFAREAVSRASAYALVDVTLDVMGLVRADPEAVPRPGEAG